MSWLIDIGFEFPVFRSEFVYDPDMSLLVLAPDPGPEASSGAPGTSQLTPNQQQIRSLDGAFQPWIIAVIVLVVVALAVTIALIVFRLRSSRLRKNKEGVQAHIRGTMGPVPKEYAFMISVPCC